MTTGALLFMLCSWFLVLALTAWSFGIILRHRGRHDPDGIGPAVPPEEPLAPSAGGATRPHPGEAAPEMHP